MKAGRTMQGFASEVQRQQSSKRDFVAGTVDLRHETVAHGEIRTPRIHVGHHGNYSVNRLAEQQIAAHLGIPQKFYDRLQERHPGLLDHNVNTLFGEAPSRRLVRTLDGHIRAFLSDRYRRIDNWDVAQAILPVLADMKVDFPSCEVTERRMYVKALFPQTTKEVFPGDPVQAGICITNSEVGLGAFSVSVLVHRVICSNGMISEAALRRTHIGGRIGEGDDEAYELFRDETLQADDRALVLKMQDVVRAAVTDETFEKIVNRLREARNEKVVNPVRAVEVLANNHGFTENEKNGVLRFLVEGGDLSRYGMVQAVTRASQDIEDYDRATDFEKLGGQILELPQAAWAYVAQN